MKYILILLMSFTFAQDLTRVERAEMSTEIQTETVASDTTDSKCEPEIVQSPTMLVGWIAFWTFVAWIVCEYAE